MRRSFRNLAIFVTALGIGSYVSLASGADAKIEAQAKSLQSDAMDVDFLSLDLKAAQKKLEDALKKCGADKCGGAVVAGIQRDLGIVLINSKKAKEGQKAFEAAFAADPNVAIGKDYLANPDVSKAWEAAKKAGAAAPTEPTTPPEKPTKPAPPPSAEGNIEAPITIAPTHYPLPFYVELPEGMDVTSVKISYKTVSMEKYKTLEAKPEGDKYYITIPCEDTQFVGEIKFYVRAYDEDKNEVEHYGTIKKPAILKLVDKLPDDVEAPTFPGGKEPDKCVEKGDCQPGFPCDKGGDRKPQGSGCEEDSECEVGLSCVENENGKKWCYDVGDTGDKKPKGGGKKIWVGADLQQDFLFIGSQTDICNEQTWACSKNGTDIGVSEASGGIPVVKGDPNAQPEAIPPGGGNTSGGPARSTTRFFLSLDYFLNDNITVGGRLGYAFLGGNPTENAKFLPWHVEARVSYFFGPPKTTGIRPYAFLSGGVAEYDAVVPNIVATPVNAAHADPGTCPPDGQACRITGIDAYRLAGQSFVAPGGGIWYFLSPTMALNVGGKILLPLPTFSPGIALEVGIKFGL